MSVEFSPDGRLLASGIMDKPIWLWDVASHTCGAVLSSQSDSVFSVSFSSDGRTLASNSSDTTVRL
jgi:WD40 repeat protein